MPVLRVKTQEGRPQERTTHYTQLETGSTSASRPMPGLAANNGRHMRDNMKSETGRDRFRDPGPASLLFLSSPCVALSLPALLPQKKHSVEAGRFKACYLPPHTTPNTYTWQKDKEKETKSRWLEPWQDSSQELSPSWRGFGNTYH